MKNSKNTKKNQKIKKNQNSKKHIILPIIVATTVGLIGLFMMRFSSAATYRQCYEGVVLRKGSDNICVKYAEQMLNIAPDTGSSVKVDNYFSYYTKAKTERFQQAKGLTKSGEIRSDTWKELCATAKTELPNVYDAAGCEVRLVGFQQAGTVNDCGTMQGGATDGEYIYFACTKWVSDKEQTKIFKYTVAGEKVMESSPFPRSKIGHANDMTYNANTKKLVVSIWDKSTTGTSGVKDKLMIVDPVTLVSERIVTTSDHTSTSNVCYNAASDQYVINGRLYDSNFVYQKMLFDNTTVNTRLGISGELGIKYDGKSTIILNQGTECDASYIYVMRVVFRQTGYNVIGVYDWSGNYVGAYRINLNDEGENMMSVNGQLYMGINEGGMSSGGDYRIDYFIKPDLVPLQ